MSLEAFEQREQLLQLRSRGFSERRKSGYAETRLSVCRGKERC